MKAKLFLRTAAVLIFIHLLGHSVGHSTWKKPDDPQMQEVVNKMLGYKTAFMGATKSMGDYYEGYSIMLFFVFAMSLSILWILSTFVANNMQVSKKILYPIAITYLCFGIIEFIYFFPFAAIISFLAGVAVFLAVLSMAESQ